MPKKPENDEKQSELLERIRLLVFGSSKTCLLSELDEKTDMHAAVLGLIPELRVHFHIHNIPGIQRPETLKRPWLSIARNLLRRKYHFLSENCIYKKDGKPVHTKRYMLVPKELLQDAIQTVSDAEMDA